MYLRASGDAADYVSDTGLLQLHLYWYTLQLCIVTAHLHPQGRGTMGINSVTCLMQSGSSDHSIKVLQVFMNNSQGLGVLTSMVILEKLCKSS